MVLLMLTYGRILIKLLIVEAEDSAICYNKNLWFIFCDFFLHDFAEKIFINLRESLWY